jgi:hypothetical protein
MPVCDFGDEDSCLTTLAGSTEPRKVRWDLSIGRDDKFFDEHP